MAEDQGIPTDMVKAQCPICGKEGDLTWAVRHSAKCAADHDLDPAEHRARVFLPGVDRLVNNSNEEDDNEEDAEQSSDDDLFRAPNWEDRNNNIWSAESSPVMPSPDDPTTPYYVQVSKVYVPFAVLALWYDLKELGWADDFWTLIYAVFTRHFTHCVGLRKKLLIQERNNGNATKKTTGTTAANSQGRYEGNGAVAEASPIGEPVTEQVGQYERSDY